MIFIKLAKNSKQSWKTSCNAQKRAQRELQAKVIRAENERDEWKVRVSPSINALPKYLSLSSEQVHVPSNNAQYYHDLPQRELDQLRQEYQKTKEYIRELEMGNDDLERNERAVSSSLADMESKYSRVLEEKILLEHELLEKAGVEEESQRLKDELRGICLFRPNGLYLTIIVVLFQMPT
jgi:hypothetical protein